MYENMKSVLFIQLNQTLNHGNIKVFIASSYYQEKKERERVGGSFEILPYWMLCYTTY